MPSPRDIPSVKQLWNKLPYDKLIEKYYTEKEAYAKAREFFINHTEYDRIVICPDDLEIQPEQLEQLLSDSESLDVVSGYCNLDETLMEVYNIQPVGCDLSDIKPKGNKQSWYNIDNLPDKKYIMVGYSGFACQIIKRDIFEKLSFTGTNGEGYFDFQMSKELRELQIPIIVNTDVLLYHRRNEQKPINNNGYELWIQSR